MKTTDIKIELNNGKHITLELYPEIAPITVQNFVDLVNEHFFDGLCFHRCIDGFMIQGGGFVADGYRLTPKNGAKTIKGEFSANGIINDLSHEPGVISMARTNVKDSASSQFFICIADCAFLNGQYAAFGKVKDEQSLKVACEIGKVETHSFSYYDDIPNDPVIMTSVKVI